MIATIGHKPFVKLTHLLLFWCACTMTDTMITVFRLDNTLAVRVRATGGAQRPLRLALLLDISESMAGERLTAVKRTLAAARSLWQPEDRTTLVTFGERGAPVLVDHLMDAAGVEAFYTAVDALHVDGCTNLSSGLEEIATATAGRNYDALVILTDGQVNRGLTGTAGLQMMAVGLSLPATTLGYGEDHNRILLRDIALRSHGSYVYCDSDETLPIAIGQLLGELRNRVTARASLAVAGDAWTCAELGGSVIGSIVPDRDYWSVWVAASAAGAAPEPTVTYISDGVSSEVVVQGLVAAADEAALVKEQSLRARVASALKAVADAMENGRPVEVAPLTALEAEIASESAEFRARGLVLRLLGELAEIRAELEHRPAPSTPPLGPTAGIRRMNAQAYSPPPGPARLMARLSSQTAYLSTQRGVSSQAPDEDMFSSPAVRMTSSGVRAHYSARAVSPAHDPAAASPALEPAQGTPPSSPVLMPAARQATAPSPVTEE